MRLESARQKMNFLMAKSIQKSYTLNCSHKFNRIVAPSFFREKPFYVKVTTFSTA